MHLHCSWKYMTTFEWLHFFVLLCFVLGGGLLRVFFFSFLFFVLFVWFFGGFFWFCFFIFWGFFFFNIFFCFFLLCLFLLRVYTALIHLACGGQTKTILIHFYKSLEERWDASILFDQQNKMYMWYIEYLLICKEMLLNIRIWLNRSCFYWNIYPSTNLDNNHCVRCIHVY